MEKKIENFEVMLGDIALAKVSRNGSPFIEVAYLGNPSIRGIFTENACNYVSGNIPMNDIQYVSNKVKRNARFLKV